MKKTYTLWFLFVLVSLMISCTSKPTKWAVYSPDKNLKVEIFYDTTVNTKQLYYSVTSVADSNKNDIVVLPSPLGITRNDNDFVQNLSFISQAPVKAIDETYKMLIGKQKEIRNRANEVKLSFKNNKNAPIDFVFRAYDDGIAFRYEFPGNDTARHSVTGESTGFVIPQSSKAWIQPYDKAEYWSPAYELFYNNGIQVDKPSEYDTAWAFPATFNYGKYWMMLTEAGLSDSYCATHLEKDSKNGLYKIRLPLKAELDGTNPVEPSYSLPWVMPWRAIAIGKSPAAIVETNIVYNLNEPSRIADVSWIKPGKASWSWWSTPGAARDFKILKKFIDLAANMGWEYSLVDAGWGNMKGGTIEELVKYGETKGVGILIWYSSGSYPRNNGRSSDILKDPVKRKQELQKIAAWGVKGIKVDFFVSDKQVTIKEYFGILKDAADNRILVNFHGCTLPRGWSRTWPNLMSMEAVAGAEQYGYSKVFPEIAAQQNTILPFTRNVVGPMDYTPVTFSDIKLPHLTSFGHELALPVVFESGITHFADKVEPYLKMPKEAKDFVRALPTVWDETRYISGYPGRDVVLARRSGKDWFIGGINGENVAKNQEIDLSFINRNYKLTIISDGKDDKSFKTKKISDLSTPKQLLNILPFGGFVIWAQSIDN